MEMIKKVEFYSKNNIKTHIFTKEKTLYNGYFKEQIEEGVFSFEDDLIGKTFIFISDIWRIDKYREKKDG